MAIIPLKQKVTIVRAQELDDYGGAIDPIRIPLKCRFQEGSKMVKRFSSGTGANQTMSEEVVASAKIIFDKYTNVLYTDTIEYVDDMARTVIYSPLKIEILRNFGGKAILTVVYV